MFGFCTAFVSSSVALWLSLTMARLGQLMTWLTTHVSLFEWQARVGFQPRWITSSEICIIIHIIRKPNSTIVLLLIQNFSKFLTSLPSRRLSYKTVAYFSARFHWTDVFFFLMILLNKYITSFEPYILRFLAFLPFRQMVRSSAISSSDIRERNFLF